MKTWDVLHQCNGKACVAHGGLEYASIAVLHVNTSHCAMVLEYPYTNILLLCSVFRAKLPTLSIHARCIIANLAC